MRSVIILLILVIVLAIVGIASGFININQVREAQAPQVSATHNGVIAKGGQAPAFDVETGTVKIGSKDATVKVPALEVQQPQGNQAAAFTNNAQ
jgi:hypothetical protein